MSRSAAIAAPQCSAGEAPLAECIIDTGPRAYGRAATIESQRHRQAPWRTSGARKRRRVTWARGGVPAPGPAQAPALLAAGGSGPVPVGKRGSSVPRGCPSDSRESDPDPAATEVKAAVLGPSCFQAQSWSSVGPGLQPGKHRHSTRHIQRHIHRCCSPHAHSSLQPPPAGNSCLGLPPHPFCYLLRPGSAHEPLVPAPSTIPSRMSTKPVLVLSVSLAELTGSCQALTGSQCAKSFPAVVTNFGEVLLCNPAEWSMRG